MGVAAALAAALISVAGSLPAAAAPGAVDQAFGQSGIATVPFPSGGEVRLMTVQPDGRIVVAGGENTPGSASSTSFTLPTTQVAVARLMPNGTADPAFGSSGVATTKLGDDSTADALALAPDGGIIVLADSATEPVSSGSGTTPSPGTASAVLLRYTPGGQLDQSFGSGGMVTLGQGQDAVPGGLAVQASGSILVAVTQVSASGTGIPTASLQRLSPTGQADPTFGTGGSVPLQGVPISVALDQTGQILVSEQGLASAPNQVKGFVQRFSTTGVPDPTFGQAGTATLPTTPTPAVPVGTLGAAGGTIYVSVQTDEDEFDVMRLTSSGSVDPTFGRDGRISISAPLDGLSMGSALQSSSNLVLLHGTNSGSIVSRALNADGTPALGYGTQGEADSPLPASSLAAFPGGDALEVDGSLVAGASSLEQSASGLGEAALVTHFTGGSAGAVTQSNSAARLSGADRLATAIAASQDLFATAPQGGVSGPTNTLGQPYAQAVVLASADAFPDALVSVPLAVADQAPLLLTHQASLDQRVTTEIQRVLGNGSSGATIYVVGGSAAVSDTVVGQLVSAGYDVKRISGADRYATAVQVASTLGDPPVLLEATGTDFADATSAGAAAAHAGGAVLLTSGSTMPSETQAYISAHTGAIRIAVGGPASQADSGAQAIVGADRYATSSAVASTLFATPTTVGVASGLGYPDALVGGVVSALLGGPLVLTDPASLPGPVSGYLKSIAPWASNVKVFGGTSAVSDAVEAAAEQAIT